jgi:hypothetical protein
MIEDRTAAQPSDGLSSKRDCRQGSPSQKQNKLLPAKQTNPLHPLLLAFLIVFGTLLPQMLALAIWPRDTRGTAHCIPLTLLR